MTAQVRKEEPAQPDADDTQVIAADEPEAPAPEAPEDAAPEYVLPAPGPLAVDIGEQVCRDFTPRFAGVADRSGNPGEPDFRAGSRAWAELDEYEDRVWEGVEVDRATYDLVEYEARQRVFGPLDEHLEEMRRKAELVLIQAGRIRPRRRQLAA